VETNPPVSTGEETLAQRREFVRRSVLRANRAVAVILAVVLLLGVVLVMMSMTARRHQGRAEGAEREATERLWKASLAQARAEVLSTQAGHRAAALEAVRTAAAIRPSIDLRNEAIAAMGLRDLVQEKQWPLKPNAYGFNFDPDLKYYLVRYTEQTLSMYRLADNSHVRDFHIPVFLRKGANVGDFMFSATGKYVVIRYNGGATVLWETETGKMSRVMGADPLTQSHSWPPGFTADDKTVCMMMNGAGGPMELYDIESGEPRHLAQLPRECVWAGFENRLAISPRGNLLAWYQGTKIHILDAATGAVQQTLTGPSLVQSVSWDDQGERLAFGCDNYTLFVWEARSGRVLQMGGKAIFTWVQRFSPDGTLLITSGNDGVTRLWDVSTARLMSQTSEGRALAVSRDGKHIAWGRPGVAVGIWRIEEPGALKLIQGVSQGRATVWQNDLSPDGRWMAWSPPSRTGPTGFELFDLEDGNRSVFVPAGQKVAVGFHPVKPQIWTAGQDGLTFRELPQNGLSRGGQVSEKSGTVPLPDGFVPCTASFSADGRFAAVAGARNALIVVDTAEPGKTVTLDRGMRTSLDIPGPGSLTGSGVLAISPDGRWVYGGHGMDGGGVPVWDARTGRIARRLPISPAHGAFSPDGRWLATVGTNHCRLWETGTWKLHWLRPRPELLTHTGAAAFTADGSLIAWSYGVDSVTLSEPVSGETVAQINLTSAGSISGLRFSADGRRLFAAGAEGRLLLMDLKNQREQLAALGLDWPLAPAKETAMPEDSDHSAWRPALIAIVPVGIAAILGTLVLRRQGRLTEEFVKATEVAAQSERELAAEREVSELKSRFVTTVSHEFRTPLGITMSAIELLRHYEDRLPADERHQLFDDIHSSTRNMAGLMEQVLVLGRVDAGKLAYRPAPLDLDVLTRKLIDESLSATNRKCPVEWTAENDLSGAAADEALLRHILSNLLSNAVKYSPPGTPVILSGRRDGKTVVFEVRDKGIGIPESDLPRLYEAFHRGVNVGEIPGTGLGLVIIKRCVDLHMGSIAVNSKTGEGTAFTVRLPAW
jgi:signal transduction histidine kinase